MGLLPRGHHWIECRPTHQDSSSYQASHVFHLLCDTQQSIPVLGCILCFKAREEEHDVADDRHRGQDIERDGDELRTGSCTHDGSGWTSFKKVKKCLQILAAPPNKILSSSLQKGDYYTSASCIRCHRQELFEYIYNGLEDIGYGGGAIGDKLEYHHLYDNGRVCMFP